MELQFKVRVGTSMTGPMVVPPGIAAKTLDFGLARGSLHVFSAYWDGISKTVVLVKFGFVAHTSWNPMRENCVFAYPCKSNGIREGFEVLNVFCKLFPDASLGEDTKGFTSWEFTLDNTPVTDSSLARGLCYSLSSSVRQNCLHHFETAP